MYIYIYIPHRVLLFDIINCPTSHLLESKEMMFKYHPYCSGGISTSLCSTEDGYILYSLGVLMRYSGYVGMVTGYSFSVLFVVASILFGLFSSSC